ncbi:hypothetical protein PENFLA_c012G08708 [Penicillium flavigenum]|uniref:Uncharacterized protein n=1 Tax=Penicillium flavigenum TaxID=254877 RepID=A0A1V6TA02_9EURO|nr:hypothetical protein PENFLA_c012G08708 [Penicillium flavigenum]
MFLHAVSNNPACQHWLNTVSTREHWSYDTNLHYVFGDFIASEGRRISNDHRLEQQASSNIASADKNKGNKDKKQTKIVYCPFHKMETKHKPKECFLNPNSKKD